MDDTSKNATGQRVHQALKLDLEDIWNLEVMEEILGPIREQK